MIQVDVSFNSLIQVFSISCVLFFCILLSFVKSDNKKANWWLVLFLLSFCMEIVDTFIDCALPNIKLPFWIQTTLLTLPMLLFYIKRTINKNIKKKYILLIIPFIAANIIQLNERLLLNLEYVFNISLLSIIWYQLIKHKEVASTYFSDLEKKTLSWIKTILIIFFVFHVLWILEDVCVLFFKETKIFFVTASNLLTLFIIMWLGYKGFTQSEIFISVTEEKTKTNNTVAIKQVESLSLIVKDETLKSFKTVDTKIKEEQFYKDVKLNLRTLSEKVAIKERDLSKLIKLHTNQNFHQYINSFRVEEFKRLLNEEKHKQITLLGLATEAGFPSKSTFYAVFKTAEGMTPKQYVATLTTNEIGDK